MTQLSPRQAEQLLLGINPDRVAFKNGLAYLEAYEVRAHLNRVFGFAGWSQEVLRYNTRERLAKGTLTIAADAQVRLTVPGAAYTDVGAADASGIIENLVDTTDNSQATGLSIASGVTMTGVKFGGSYYAPTTPVSISGTLSASCSVDPGCYGWTRSSGAPTVTAPKGTIYERIDGTAGTLLYVNTSGTTSWSAFA